MGMLVTAGEVKNWSYCRRIVYYRRLMPGASAATFKMEEALRAQDMIERLESRRTLSAYGVEGYQRRLGIWLSSPRLGANGKLDLLLESEREAIPVDFKLTSGEPGENHRMQLALYALLVEEVYGLAVNRALLYRIPDDRVYEMTMDLGTKQQAEYAVQAIAQMQIDEVFPEPTPVRGRCRDCEYSNFCGDVW